MPGKVSIIIPVYNEQGTVAELLKRTMDLPIEKELIVVNDCSTDGTAVILKNYNHNLIKVITHPVNKGKGAAIRTGLEQASGDIVVIQDADLELEPKDILSLIQPIREGKAKAVYGVRVDYMKLIHRHIFLSIMIDLALDILYCLLFILYGYKVSDMMTCYKVMPAELFRSLDLKSDGFEVEAEVTVKLLKRKIKPLELPVYYNPRYYGNGKKIKWFDAVKVALTIIKFRFVK